MAAESSSSTFVESSTNKTENISLNLDCAICEQATKPGHRVKLTEKGCFGINSASRERGDNLQVKAGQLVHAKCKDYTHPNSIAALKRSVREGTPSPVKKRSLRSHQKFYFKAQCVFCCQSTEPLRNRKVEKLIPVRTDCFQESIVKAIYHNVCSTNFRKGSGIPQSFSDEAKGKKPKGRPENPVRNRAFQDVKVQEFGDYEQVTLQDLVSLMQQSLDQVEGTEEAYTPHHMKNKLKGHFGDDIYFNEIPGKSDVVVLRRNVSKLLHTFYTSTPGADVSSQAESLMKTAGQLILSEIKAMPNARTYYPSFGEDHSVSEQIQYICTCHHHYRFS
ncbi:hypothetical protein BaRGS_00014524 [Batillaria attramentaria]|uniref:Uncharacterized protein n=1 Tax=Batillaria attramentaria TaxID=370345 RepID=A0ABD0L4H8_9CAEN